MKAAFLKCAVERHGIVGDVPRILAAVAAASLETGAPIMVHTNAVAQTGLPALEALTNEGVEPPAIIIAHAGDSNDLAVPEGDRRHRRDPRVSTGSTSRSSTRDADRIKTLVALVAEGYGDRIHLGHDAACFYDFMVGDPNFADEKPDYLHISRTILPALLAAGVTQEQVDEMLVANPRRAFESRGS